MKKFLVLCLTLAMFVVTVAARPVQPPTTTGGVIPVLCYHVIDTVTSHYSTTVANFKDQMAYLNSNGYTTLSAEEYYNIMSGAATAPAKPILLTFDDSTSDFYNNAYPVLKQYGMKAIEFAVSNWIDTPGKLTTAQLQTLAANNIDIQNHSTNHEYFSRLTYDQQFAAINDSNAKIASITGKTPQYLAYPYGDYDADTIAIAKSLGMKMAFVVGNGLTTPATDKFTLGRNMILSADSISTFIRKIS